MSIQLKDANNNIIEVQNLQFAGGERHIQIAAADLTQLAGLVQVQAKLNNSQDVMDYLLLENVLLNQGLSIALEIPYFPYARQDRVCATGQAFSLDIMSKLLNINAEQFPQQRQSIMVWDAHSCVTEKLLHENTHFLEIKNVQPSDIILQSNELTEILKAENAVLICPDAGARQRSKHIAKAINALRQQPIEVIYCDKKRNPETGKIMNSHVNATDLRGKVAVITDDICDGGATFKGIAEELKKLNCEQVLLYVTHGIFSKGFEVFTGLVDQIFTTDSFAQTEHDNLTIINFSANASLNFGE